MARTLDPARDFSPFGGRSGVVNPRSSLASILPGGDDSSVVAAVGGGGAGAPGINSPRTIGEMVQIAQLEIPHGFEYWGPRSDLPAGVGVRLRVGLLADAVHYGAETYTSTGSHTVQFSA